MGSRVHVHIEHVQNILIPRAAIKIKPFIKDDDPIGHWMI